MLEIERKFLVTSDAFIAQAFAKNQIAQGYLNSHPERTVRVRIKGESGFLTIKGKGDASGTTRFEWETEISLQKPDHCWLYAKEALSRKRVTKCNGENTTLK
jgi:CYTH domain-containing protein